MKAKSSDAHAIATLHRGSFCKGWREADVQGLLKSAGSLAFIIRIDAQLAGFLLARSLCGEAEIISLAVDRLHRRRGLASRLLAALETGLVRDRCTRIFLEVDETNVDAIQLYYRYGFEKAGLRKNYYASQRGQRTNALVLMKNIYAGTL